MTRSVGEHDATPPQGAALREAKLAMRRRVLAARDALAPAARAAAGAAIAARVTGLAQFAAARCVLLTLPFRSEWDTLPVLHAALAAGKTVTVPRVNKAARMLEVRAIADPAADVVESDQGIPEPRASCPCVALETIDFVLVPGVAFDAAGRRLGYGGGYYDRLLPLLCAGAARVAGAYELQIVDHVPSAPHDLPVDAIITEARTLAPRR